MRPPAVCLMVSGAAGCLPCDICHEGLVHRRTCEDMHFAKAMRRSKADASSAWRSLPDTVTKEIQSASLYS